MTKQDLKATSNGEDSKPAAKKPDQTAKDLYEKVWKPMRQANTTKTAPTDKVGQDPTKEDPAPAVAKAVPEVVVPTKPTPVPHVAEPVEEPTPVPHVEVPVQESPTLPSPLDSIFQELVVHPTSEHEDTESSDSSSSLSTNSNSKRRVYYYRPRRTHGHMVHFVKRHKGPHMYELVGHFVGPRNVPYIEIKVDGVPDIRKFRPFMERFPMFVMEYAYRNRLRDVTNLIWNRYYRHVSNCAYVHGVLTEPIVIYPFGNVYREPLTPAMGNIRRMCMQRRSTSDENVDPRILNIPAIVRMPAIYNHIRPPHVVNVERMRTVTVSYEYENPDGTIDVYTQLFPYEDSKAIWRDEWARYILSDSWWHRRDDIYGWAYDYYEDKHNIPRGISLRSCKSHLLNF